MLALSSIMRTVVGFLLAQALVCIDVVPAHAIDPCDFGENVPKTRPNPEAGATEVRVGVFVFDLVDVVTKNQEFIKDVYEERSLLAAVFDDAMSDTRPLSGLIKKYVNDEMLRAIAKESQKGRILFVATTNLDALRPVLWNMGEIAASGHPAEPF